MSIADSFTFWAGQFLFKLAVTVVILVVCSVVLYFTQDDKEKHK